MRETGVKEQREDTKRERNGGKKLIQGHFFY